MNIYEVELEKTLTTVEYILANSADDAEDIGIRLSEYHFFEWEDQYATASSIQLVEDEVNVLKESYDMYDSSINQMVPMSWPESVAIVTTDPNQGVLAL